MDIRPPYASGVFYMGYDVGLEREVRQCIKKAANSGEPKHAIAAIVPHAGYEYSGTVAASVYARIKLPETFVIIGPNHSGFGADVALDDKRAWRTPLGEVELDRELGEAILKGSSHAHVSYDAHRLEHSVEVQLPFLQHMTQGRVRFVPIAIRPNLALETCEEVGLAIADAVKRVQPDALVIGSSDMTHYEPLATAEHQDLTAINAILTLEPAHLLETVEDCDITMCGPGPVAATIYAANELGATQAELVSYSTSAEFSMNENNVVGYAGIVIA